MIVNVYFTDGMFEWGELFINSFNYFHPNIKIIAITRNLNKNQVNKLSCKAIIENNFLSYEKLARKINVSVDKLIQMKKEVETGKTHDGNQPWKWLIAGGDRIDSLYEIVKKYNSEGVLHFDADTYIRNNISGLLNMVKKFNLCLRQRPNDKNIIRRAVISMMGFYGKESVVFMDKWKEHLKDIDLFNTKKTFDQKTCYYAIQDLKNKIKIGNMKKENGYPFISTKEEENADIWFGNCGNRGQKIIKFRRDYEKKMGCIN